MTPPTPQATAGLQAGSSSSPTSGSLDPGGPTPAHTVPHKTSVWYKVEKAYPTDLQLLGPGEPGVGGAALTLVVWPVPVPQPDRRAGAWGWHVTGSSVTWEHSSGERGSKVERKEGPSVSWPQGSGRPAQPWRGWAALWWGDGRTPGRATCRPSPTLWPGLTSGQKAEPLGNTAGCRC